jgi:hypothetical protein
VQSIHHSTARNRAGESDGDDERGPQAPDRSKATMGSRYSRGVRASVLVLIGACGRIGFSPGSTDGSTPATTYYLISTPGTSDPSTVLALAPATGQLAVVGTLQGFGILGGLAYWDANTLYATSNNPGRVVQITLSPFAGTQIATYTGSIASLERDGDVLIGMDDATNELVTFAPGGTMSRMPINSPSVQPPASDGGDLTRAPDGTWYWFTNATNTLYVLDPATARVTPVGAPAAGVPYVSGLFHDDAGRMFVTSSSSHDEIEIDPATGQIGGAQQLCVDCPTAYSLEAGDSTRTPDP